jgi:hypothetical protein
VRKKPRSSKSSSVAAMWLTVAGRCVSKESGCHSPPGEPPRKISEAEWRPQRRGGRPGCAAIRVPQAKVDHRLDNTGDGPTGAGRVGREGRDRAAVGHVRFLDQQHPTQAEAPYGRRSVRRFRGSTSCSQEPETVLTTTQSDLQEPEPPRRHPHDFRAKSIPGLAGPSVMEGGLDLLWGPSGPLPCRQRTSLYQGLSLGSGVPVSGSSMSANRGASVIKL